MNLPIPVLQHGNTTGSADDEKRELKKMMNPMSLLRHDQSQNSLKV